VIRTRPRENEIVEVGTDFQASSLDVLGRARVSDDWLSALLARLAPVGVGELVLLSTCNRFEIYAVTDAPEEAIAALEAEIGAILADEEGDVDLLVRRGDEAVYHLVAVAAGLESALLGEHEILGQVRRAYASAAEAGAAGRVLGRLFKHAVRHGHRIRRGLGISGLRRSLTDVAAALIASKLAEPERRAAALVGAGETAAQMARHLRTLRIGTLTVLNRSPSPSRELARAVNGRAESLDRLATLLPEIDLLVLATAAPGPLLEESVVRRALQGRRGYVLVVDLGLSPNAESAVARHPLVTTLTLSDVVALAVAESKRERPPTAEVETWVEEAVADFASRQRSGMRDPLRAPE
jgi:glutamyl-tRNA reductase